MLLLSATDIAIARAAALNTLRLVEASNVRLRVPFVSIEDDHGVIEVHSTLAEAAARVGDCAGGRRPAAR